MAGEIPHRLDVGCPRGAQPHHRADSQIHHVPDGRRDVVHPAQPHPYNACYVVLARRTGAALLTLDKRLMHAPALGIPLLTIHDEGTRSTPALPQNR